MNKKVNFYFAALLGTMSPLCAVPALASHSIIATAMQQDNSCTGKVLDATGEPLIGGYHSCGRTIWRYGDRH